MENAPRSRMQLKMETAEARRLRNESERKRELEQIAETTEKLRRLRLAQETEGEETTNNAPADKKPAAPVKPGRLPQVHRR